MRKIKKLVVLALAVGMLATSILGASAAFDPVYYAAQNPDVVKALGNSPAMLKLHYDMFGRKEARMSNKNDVEAQLRRLFDEKEYAKLYPDVKKAFGDDKEMMFKHYIAFGLLEGRRPSEKVSQAAAVSMKKTVEKAMKDAGLAATPGTAEVVAVITGETSNVVSTGGAAVQQALTQVAAVVAKEVTATVKEVQNPTPASSGSSSSSSSNSTREPVINWVEVGTEEDLTSALANDASGNNFKLKNTIAVNATKTVSRSVTIDLNGYNITCAGTVFKVSADKELIVMNSSSTKGTIENTKSDTDYYKTAEPAVLLYGSNAKLTLENKVEVKSTKNRGVRLEGGAILDIKSGAKVTSGYWAVQVTGAVGAVNTITSAGDIEGMNGITVNGNLTGDNVINITGGTVKGTGNVEGNVTSSAAGDEEYEIGMALYLAGKTTTTISGGIIEGTGTAVEVRDGELNVTGGTIKSTCNTAFEGKVNGAGASTKGAAIAASTHGGRNVTLNITGGTIEATSSPDKVAVVVTNGLATPTSGTVTVQIADDKVAGGNEVIAFQGTSGGSISITKDGTNQLSGVKTMVIGENSKYKYESNNFTPVQQP